MKIRLGDLRKIIREALESVGAEELAAVKRQRGDHITVVLYRPAVLRSALLSTADQVVTPSKNPLTEAMKSGGTVGLVTVFRPRVDCGGAWELGEIWGPRYGRLLVDIAFGLSPSRKIVIDRTTVLEPGRDLWNRVTVGMKSEPLPLGCTTQHDDEVLNKIYIAPEGIMSPLEGLTAHHDDLMNKLSGDYNLQPKVIETAIVDAGHSLFGDTW